MKGNLGGVFLTACAIVITTTSHTVSSEKTERLYKYSYHWNSPNYKEPSSALTISVSSLWKEEDGGEELSFYSLPETKERFLLHTLDSEIKSIYFEKGTLHKNYLKGIASLFLYRTDSWNGWQKDVSGDCFVQYTPQDNKILKEKKECVSEETIRHKFHDDQRLYSWSSSSTLDLKKDNSLLGLDVKEKLVKMDPMKGAYAIESQQNVKLIEENIIDDILPKNGVSNVVDAIGFLNNVFKTEFIGEDITTLPESKARFKATDIKPIKSFLKDNKLSTPEGAKAFIGAVKMLKSAEEKSISALLKDKSNKNIMPQLMDILGSVHTRDAFNAVLSVYKPSKSINVKLLERFIWALSSVEHFWTPQNHHNEYITSEIFKHLKTSKFASMSLKESFMISLSLICNNVKSNEEYLNWFLNSLKECRDDDCSLKYVKALRNIDYSLQEAFRSDVFNVVKNVLKSDKSSKRLKLDAIKLSKVVAPELNEGLQTILLTMFMSPQEDNSVRIAIFDLLVKNNFDAGFVIYVLRNLSGDAELEAYVINKLSSHQKMKFIQGDLIQSGHWNWNLLSTSGQSLSFLDHGDYFSTDFGLELSSSKILKHGHLHINLLKVSDFLQMELNTGGLSGFIAEQADPNDDPSAHLSVELSLLGVPLRPFVVFSSMSELTSLYWSGSLETKQPLLGFNRFVYDSVSIHAFSSGLRIESVLEGAFSMDISGSIVVSLFSQTADSQMTTGFGGYVKKSLIGHWKDQNIFSDVHEGDGKFALDLDGDIRFDGRSCVQLKVQPVNIREETNKSSMDTSTNKPVTQKETKNINLQGQTLSLHHKISQLCKEVS